jgi:MFS family permease
MLGLTSLMTDVSSEMVASILPLYALFFLQTSPIGFGIVDGLQRGGPALMRLLGGSLTDRWRRHKEIAAVGYLASAVSRLSLLLIGRSPIGLVAAVTLDRLGKGLRTSPRDALISLSVPRAGLAAGFGIHRALDTTGAMLGPILAFAILRWVRGGYDVVFVVSLAFALIGLAILVAFVTNPGVAAGGERLPALSTGAAIRRLADRRYAVIAISAGVLGLATISDSFIYLALQNRLGFDPSYLPLFFVATPAVYLTLSVPVGRVADRVGRAKVIVAGYSALLILYGTLLLPLPGPVLLVSSVVLLGAFYAASEGVFLAAASAVLTSELRATGLSIVGTCNDVGRMVSSVLFGWLWSRGSAQTAVGTFSVALILVLLWAGTTLVRAGREGAHA